MKDTVKTTQSVDKVLLVEVFYNGVGRHSLKLIKLSGNNILHKYKIRDVSCDTSPADGSEFCPITYPLTLAFTYVVKDPNMNSHDIHIYTGIMWKLV